MPGGKGKIRSADGKPWKKGQSGNPKGGPGAFTRRLPDIDQLMARVLAEEKDGRTAMEAILMALRGKAAKGDIRAAEVLLDRAYGKIKQELGLTSTAPLEVVINRRDDNDTPDAADTAR